MFECQCERIASFPPSSPKPIPAKQLKRPVEGWVVEIDGQIVAFAIGNKTNGNIWALFVDPDHERRGYGRQLHDEMLTWLWGQGLGSLWLTTEPGTRAERFYEKAGWKRCGITEKGEMRFEKTEAQQAVPADGLASLGRR